MLTGKPVFFGETIINKIVAHRDHAIPSLRKHRPEVSSELDAVFHKLVSKRRDDRYESMADVLRDLDICQNGGSGLPSSTVI